MQKCLLHLCAYHQDRQELVDRFQEDNDIVYLFGTIRTVGVGFNITKNCSDAIFMELGWTPAEHKQAEDRCILEGTLVLTNNGYKKIEDINIGDKVQTFTIKNVDINRWFHFSLVVNKVNYNKGGVE